MLLKLSNFKISEKTNKSFLFPDIFCYSCFLEDLNINNTDELIKEEKVKHQRLISFSFNKNLKKIDLYLKENNVNPDILLELFIGIIQKNDKFDKDHDYIYQLFNLFRKHKMSLYSDLNSVSFDLFHISVRRNLFEITNIFLNLPNKEKIISSHKSESLTELIFQDNLTMVKKFLDLGANEYHSEVFYTAYSSELPNSKNILNLLLVNFFNRNLTFQDLKKINVKHHEDDSIDFGFYEYAEKVYNLYKLNLI